MDECYSRVFIGEDGRIDDVWVIGGHVDIDGEVIGVVIVCVRCDCMCKVIEV